MVISQIQGFERIMKLTCFSYFGCGFKIKASVIHEYVMNNQEHVKIAYEHLRLSRKYSKNLNNYQHALIINSHYSNIKKKVREINYTCMQDLNGGVKKTNSTLVEVLWVKWRRRIRRGRVSFTQYLESQEEQDMTRLTLLHQNSRGEKR